MSYPSRPHVLLALALALALSGCDAPPDKAAPSTAAPPSSAARAPTSAAASASAPPPAPSAAAPRDPFAGTWAGRFEAKKGSVTLAPKVKDKVLAADDGKTAVGEGTLEITVSPGGDVRGKAKGALGAGVVTGRVEDGALRARIEPEDPRAEGVMSGVLLGRVEGEVIHATIQAAGPDATRVREATVDLQRK